MPIYEYKCKKCGGVNEFLMSINAAKPDEGCPDCGSKKLMKMMSLFGVPGGGGSSSDCGSCSSHDCSSCH